MFSLFFFWRHPTNRVRVVEATKFNMFNKFNMFQKFHKFNVFLSVGVLKI